MFLYCLTSIFLMGWGPSSSEQAAHEARREKAEQELDDNWEDDLDQMMEEPDGEIKKDSTSVSNIDDK
jgi:hypothetical protein